MVCRRPDGRRPSPSYLASELIFFLLAMVGCDGPSLVRRSVGPLRRTGPIPLLFGKRLYIFTPTLDFDKKAGDDVYLGPSTNSDATCLNGVFRYISDHGRRGTPVTFTKFNYTGSSGSGIHVTEDINIQFDNASLKLCGNNTTWRFGDFDVFQGARLLETGGTIIGSWFKIVKASQSPIGRDIYVLLNCPGPLVCPSCPVDECQSLGVVLQEGKRRLALVRHQPLRVQFSKV
ncbi:aspartic protease inhibitor 6-like [Capsicum annuum]|uniref:aspartic protease inhibitor 6-like n=1 Tax=Capsicum annuum TaxID=4072 RepID=UPI001FB12F61|nr:aspartic protease inhibitor 6-like [Capsicum annuum]